MTTSTQKTDPLLFPMEFSPLGDRHVQADFSAGHLSTDGGVLLLRQIDRGLGVSRELAACFRDERDPRFVEHALQALLSQRLYALALGYEDLNDHADLRRDPLFAVAVDKPEPLGQDRLLPEDRGNPLAAPSTLNRLELSNNKSTRYHKLHHDPAAVQACVLTLQVRCLPKHTREIILDLDATGTLVHGLQEGRFTGHSVTTIGHSVSNFGHCVTSLGQIVSVDKHSVGSRGQIVVSLGQNVSISEGPHSVGSTGHAVG